MLYQFGFPAWKNKFIYAGIGERYSYPSKQACFCEGGKKKPDIRPQTMHLFPSNYGTTKRRSSVNREEGGVAFLNEGYASYLGLVQFFPLLFSGERRDGEAGVVCTSRPDQKCYLWPGGKGRKGKLLLALEA